MFGKQIGILKHPGYNGKSSAPKTPDYVGAANATAAGNLEAARATASANRVNQYTPYGNLVYTTRGTDQYGNDLYDVTQTLSPSEQAKLTASNTLDIGLLGTAGKGLDYAQGVLEKPGVDTSKLAQVGINPGETYSDAIMRRLQPQIQQEQNQFETRMANAGIAPGTEAYENAKRSLTQAQNDRETSAIVQGIGQGLAARQQGFQETAYNQMQPINVINALRTGTQVQNPNFVNPVQQSNPGGADILGATQSQYSSDLAATNAQNAASGNFWGGLMGLGGAALGAPVGKFSKF